ncbi:MAG: hypothetical protein ABFC57_03265 [Veillonellales bacterium]
MDNTTITKLQREFFQILDNSFKEITGMPYHEFASMGEFANGVHTFAKVATPESLKALLKSYQSLADFYSKNATKLFMSSKELSGIKLVFGGSRFMQTQFNSVRKMLLYSDTILIPDPILPWIESTRKEEEYRDVLFLENMFNLLYLKPLVDADLDYPAILVFPSWEKSLEREDETTQLELNNLIINFFSHFLSQSFYDINEIFEYANKKEAIFLDTVEKHSLFIAPEENRCHAITKSVEKYKLFLKTWRSEEYLNKINTIPTPNLIITGICERLIPQYHLLENASELSAQPAMCIPAQEHYFNLCSQLFEDNLKSLNLLDLKTVSIMKSLNNDSLQWLGNIPVETLVELRQNGENESFRKQLNQYIDVFSSSTLADINHTTKEVSKGIASLLQEHQKTVKSIQEKYQRIYSLTAITGWSTLAASFIPSLAPFLGVAAPLGLIATYGASKYAEIKEQKRLAKSMMGVLSATQSST